MEQKLLYVESVDSEFKRKRRRLMVVFAMQAFLNGLQHGVIIPTLWPYLRQFDVHPFVLAVTLTAHEIVATISRGITKRIFEKTLRTNRALFVLSALSVVGNLLYSLPFSVWMPVIGRVITAASAGLRPICDGELASLYHTNHHFRVFTVLGGCRLVGLLFAPPTVMAFTVFEFEIREWRYSAVNSPGILFALSWSILLLITSFTVSDLSRDYFGQHTWARFENEEEQEPMCNPTEVEIEKSPGHYSFVEAEYYRDVIPFRWKMCNMMPITWCAVDLSAIFAAAFTASLVSFSFETLSLLIIVEYFHWPLVALSLTNSAIGLYAVLLTLTVGSFSRLIRGELWVMTSAAICCGGLLLLIVYRFFDVTSPLSAITYLVSLTFGASGVVLCMLGSRSLLLQLLSPSQQETGRRVLYVVRETADVVAPLTAVLGFYHLNSFSILLVLLSVCSLIWLGLAYDNLGIRHHGRKRVCDVHESCDGLAVAFTT